MVASRRIEIVIVRLKENDGRRNETSSYICTKVNTKRIRIRIEQDFSKRHTQVCSPVHLPRLLEFRPK